MLALRKKSYDKPRQHVKKKRHHFANKGPYSQAMVFPVVMYEYENWTIKKAECQRIDAFKLWFWRRLESPLDSKEIEPVNLKGNQPCMSLEGMMLKLKLQYFGHLMRKADSLEKTLMLGKAEGKRRRG